MTPRLPVCAVLVALCAATWGCTAIPDESENVGEAAQAQVVCPAGETVEGIDVSVYQGDIDWVKVKAAGIGFAIARASYGTTKDTYFDQNWAGMKAAGVVRGAYQYWRPSKDPIEQAQAMLDFMGPLDPADLPPVVDVEQSDGLGAAQIVDRLGKWIAHVEAATGRKPIIYSGKYFWQDSVKSSAFLDYPYWIPNYSLDCPDLPTGYWPDWHFFQYTDSGHVNGIAGNVDRDTFNGSLQDLYTFVGSGGPKYAAKFVSQSFPYASADPVEILSGQKLTLSLELKNIGKEPWNESTRLATTEPRDRKSAFAGKEWPADNRYAQVEGVVMPGETYKFTWMMHGPAETGLYDEHFGLVQEDVAWFSDPGQGGPPDAQLEGIFNVSTPDPIDASGQFGPLPGGGRPPKSPDNGSTGGGETDGDDDDDVNTQSGCSTSGPPGGAGGGALFAAALALSAALRLRRRDG